MKFLSLTLERYGHFTDQSLDFSGDDILLHVVHGQNESGKSTILAAILDLLFGFPGQTTFNFLHDYKSLRVGAEIIARSGARLAFKRRKGTAGTLLSPQETTLPDGALAEFLGGADRALFERMFGLDHQRLREAGRRMIESDGDLGRSLFEAGSGLDNVTSVIDGLADDLDRLGGPERKSAKKPLWQAADAFAEAQNAKRQLALRHEEFQAAEAALESAIAERAAIGRELATIRETRSRLERIRRAGPILSEIDRLSDELTDYAQVPDLPPSFAGDWRKLAERSILAETARDVAREAWEINVRDLEAIPQERVLSPFRAEITLLYEKLGEYVKGIADEPKLARDILACDEDIAALARSLGLNDPALDIRDLLPKPALVAKVRATLREGSTLRTKRDSAEQELAKASRCLAEAENDFAAFAGASDPAKALSLAEAAARFGAAASALEANRKEAEKTARIAQEALRRLKGWNFGLETLAATPFPDQQILHACDERLRSLASAQDAAIEKQHAAEAESIEISAELAGLAAAGEIPSAEAVRSARDRRDELWRLIRDSALNPQAVPPKPGEAAELAGAYEANLRHTDELADRRMAEAQRVARFIDLTARQERLRALAPILQQRLDEAQSGLDRFWTDWRALWTKAEIEAETPAGMRAWLSAKDEALRALADQRLAQERFERTTADAAQGRALLEQAARQLGLPVADAAAFDALDREVRASIKRHETLWKKRQSAQERADRERRLLEEKTSEATRLRIEEKSWWEGWAHLAGAIGCQSEAGADEAEAVLSLWDQMRGPLTKRTDTERRLRGLRDDNENFRTRAALLASEIARAAVEGGSKFPIDSAGAPDALIRDLAARLEAETLRLQRRADLEARVATTRHTLDQASAELAATLAGVAEFRSAYHLDEDADIVEIGSCAARKRQLGDDLQKRLEALAFTGEGFDEAALRAQVASTSPDAATAELAALAEREAERVEHGQAAAQAETQAERALDDLRGKSGAALADLEARSAALAFAQHAERWLLLKTAQHLVARAIERYRAENEHPMIRRAGDLLARIAAGAGNPIVKLAVDYRDGGNPAIVGLRRDGRRCDVAEMSEGTRDQLFLCLRIAAIELYARDLEPLPFIADDLFITSDETRVHAGLAALAELGRTTQVILFTHHAHVAEAARALPQARVKIHALTPASMPASMPAAVEEDAR